MQQNTPPSIPTPPDHPTLPETQNDPASSTIFDWFDFLDFNLDETLNISAPHTQPEQPGFDQTHSSENLGRVRKRDPKLVCPNFLAGRIPCACPEMDAMLEEEETVLPGKKRTRTVRVSGGAQGRCQVSGCEADISELKGYHKRHRVCLRCANASSVLLDGENKRYCQQCGKFHILSDFDEGKRSCRRKLERHNNRRRRKPNDSKRDSQKEGQQIILADDVSEDDDTGKGVMYVSGDDDARKDVICPSNQSEERGILLESDGHVSTQYSAPASQSLRSDTVASVAASGETHMNGEKQNPMYKRSESYSENKNTFSSMCPSGRISFKLYDWNPAEFPRRLRHQIFQWLASMPIELEGYIRPGCTILTAFIAMPKPMWLKLSEEPALCIKDLIASPQSMLSGRGTMLVYLNDTVFRVTKDATSVVKVKLKNQAPKLHYIYPTCFEAGRPMEFIACGSNLLQPNFRFLVSFAGKYLAHNISVSSLCCKKGDANSFGYQYLRIYIPLTDVDLFGPAFIEVENESGLSNFIPILVGDKETCAEMEILQQKIGAQEKLLSRPKPGCEDFASRQAEFSEFVIDVAWSLKKPVSEKQFTNSHVQRFNYLLNFLIEKDSFIVLERVFCSLKSALNNNLVAGISGDEMTLLQKNMAIAQSILDHKLQGKDFTVMRELDGHFCSQSFEDDNRSAITAMDKGMQRTIKNMLGSRVFPPSADSGEIVPLLNNEVVMNVSVQERPTKLSCQRSFTRTFFTSRQLLVAITALCVCFGVCAVVLHPQRVTQIATTIRRCLFDSS